ncbi:MAG: prephenate dehydrogenase [Dehalococcoidia bacterium]
MARITVIGTGLIGTSLGLALMQSPLKDLELIGTDAAHSARSGADKRRAFHKVDDRLLRAVDGADMVVLATPIMAMEELLEIIGPELPEDCVVTDVGSSKKVVLDWADKILPNHVHFVGGHPMAGKEEAGPEAAEADLFQNRTYAVVPSIKASQRAVAEVTTMIENIGAKPYFISVDEHDSFVAAASHLPFMLSMALVGCTSKSANWDDIAQLASTGYRDITRLASGDTVMHRDICVSNPEPIVAWIDAFIRELYEVRKLLDGEGELDSEAIKNIFDQAAEARAKWVAGQFGPEARQYSPHTELPTFAESMGEMFAGRKIIEAQKRMFRRGRGDQDKR